MLPNPQLQPYRNKILRLLDPSKKKHVNCVALNTGSTYEHELAKFSICFNLQQRGLQYLTEATFKNGGRCDILSLDEEVIYEIMVSETKQKLANKRYPKELTLIAIPVEVHRSVKSEELRKKTV